MPPFTPPQDATAVQDTTLTDGNQVATFDEAGQLKAQLLDSSGSAVGPTFTFQNEGNGGYTGAYDIVAQAGGGYAVLRTFAASGGSSAVLSIMQSNNAQSADFSVGGGTTFNLYDASNGGLLVTTGLSQGLPQAQYEPSEPLLRFFDANGAAASNGGTYDWLMLAGKIQSVATDQQGSILVNWQDGDHTDTMVVNPNTDVQDHTPLITPATPSVTILDGSQTVASGGTINDTTPTVRVAVQQTGEVFVQFGPDPSYEFNAAGIQVTSADVSRGYIDVPETAAAGNGQYWALVRVTDPTGSSSELTRVSFDVSTSSAQAGKLLQGGSNGSVLVGGPGDDILIGGPGPDTMTGGGGHDRFVFDVAPTSGGQVTDFNPTTDRVDLGYLLEQAGYRGTNPLADGYVRLGDDGHGGTDVYFDATPSTDATGTLVADLSGVALAQITASDVAMGAATPQAAVQMGFDEVLRQASPTPADQTFHDQLISQANAGTLTTSQAASQIVQHAEATTSVATLAYEFFTGQAPTAAGMDYLVSPTGPNPDNLNSAYYQAFNLQNRYINFAVNLGVHGQGAQAFAQAYGSGDIYQATAQAYQTIFGTAPSDAKAHALIDTDVSFGGQTMTRGQYFALYGGDGANGVGTKAAMVGWLLAEAATENVGTYAQSNDAFLTDVALHSAPFGVDIVGHYAQPGFAYTGG